MRTSWSMVVALGALVALVGSASATAPAPDPSLVGTNGVFEKEAAMTHEASRDQFRVHVARVMEAMDRKIAVLEGLKRETDLLIEMLSTSAPAMMPVTAGIQVGFEPGSGVPDEGKQCGHR